MQKLFLAGVALLFSGPAFAADLAIAPAPVPVAYASWTGFYIGVHAGAAWGGVSSGSINDPNGLLASGSFPRWLRAGCGLAAFRPGIIGSLRPCGLPVLKAIFPGPHSLTNEEEPRR